MSEMLGNQYFMARNYAAAHNEFERVLLKDPCNKLVTKKQIICYTQIGEIQKALTLFHYLVKTDIELIVDTDEIHDDCPCPEIIEQMNNSHASLFGKEEHLRLAILWLYCDINESINYFKISAQEYKESALIKSILNKLQHYKTSAERN